MKRKDLENYIIEINIEVVDGGFILSYPDFNKTEEIENKPLRGYLYDIGQRREVCHTRAKLNKKLKEVIDGLTEK
ncbi:MAG: hypothetical protein QXN55_01025 [Candidatus Nitrosotenuis sp.]